MHTCVVQRPRRPQLSDTILKLDEMIDSLSTAIPGAVAESVQQVLGTGLVAAIRDAVREAVKEGVKEAVQAAVAEAVTAVAAVSAPPVAAKLPAVVPVKTRPSVGSRLRAGFGCLKRWAGRRAARVLARLVLGWTIVKIVGGSTLRSRSAALWTALSGAVAGFAGYVAGPIGAAILLGLVGSAVTAVAAWTAPAVRLLTAFRDD